MIISHFRGPLISPRWNRLAHLPLFPWPTPFRGRVTSLASWNSRYYLMPLLLLVTRWKHIKFIVSLDFNVAEYIIWKHKIIYRYNTLITYRYRFTSLSDSLPWPAHYLGRLASLKNKMSLLSLIIRWKHIKCIVSLDFNVADNIMWKYKIIYGYNTLIPGRYRIASLVDSLPSGWVPWPAYFPEK